MTPYQEALVALLESENTRLAEALRKAEAEREEYMRGMLLQVKRADDNADALKAARADAERATNALHDLYCYVRDHPNVFGNMLPADHPYQKARVTVAALAAHWAASAKAVTG